ncbi:MAG: type 4a pilus biogenesis protein PilO [Deltaproteobacteria bacterium]|nr:type 4a pilus biogenesis protein PilO [Deltaproteobacteria bacterium]
MIRPAALRSIANVLFEKAEKLGRTKRIVIFLATFLILGGAFFYFGYMPKSEAIDRLEGSVADLEQQVRLAEIRAKKIDEIRKDFTRTEKKLQEAMKLLPDKREIPSLLKSISQKGIESNLDFILFMPGKERSRDFYMEIPVTIEVKGEFREAARFFDEVRRMERIVNIRNIAMKPEKEMATELVTQCNALTYRFKVKADIEAEKKQKKKKK